MTEVEIDRARKYKKGRRFGKLTLVKQYQGINKAAARAVFACDCGTTKEIIFTSVTRGRTKSCGCMRRESTIQRCTTHGQKGTREYNIWMGIRRRCNCSTDLAYVNYGGRGIKLADEWNDFSRFLADMGPVPEGYSIERIDVNGNYCPENCKWIPRKLQSSNTRRSLWIEFKGKKKIFADWCTALGIPKARAYSRLRRGWPIEKVFSKDNLSALVLKEKE